MSHRRGLQRRAGRAHLVTRAHGRPGHRRAKSSAARVLERAHQSDAGDTMTDHRPGRGHGPPIAIARDDRPGERSKDSFRTRQHARDLFGQLERHRHRLHHVADSRRVRHGSNRVAVRHREVRQRPLENHHRQVEHALEAALRRGGLEIVVFAHAHVDRVGMADLAKPAVRQIKDLACRRARVARANQAVDKRRRRMGARPHQ